MCVQCGLNLGTEMEGESDEVGTIGVQLVNYLDATRRRVQSHCPLMTNRGRQCRVAVVTGSPDKRPLSIDERLGNLGVCLSSPKKGPTRLGLIALIDLHGVVGDSGTEVPPPGRFPLVAERSGIGKYVDTVMANLDGERVGMCVGSD